MISTYTSELRYIRNVSPKTLDLYKYAFQAFDGALDSRATVIARVGEMREKGMNPVTVNTYLRCVNAYFMWLHKENGKELVKIPKLKEEQKLLETISAETIAKICLTREPRASFTFSARYSSIPAFGLTRH